MKKLFLFLFVLALTCCVAGAQNLKGEQAGNDGDEKVFLSVEQPPQFPGGEAALMSYLASHIHFPASAVEQGIEGRVILQFVVTKAGQVGEIKVIRSLSDECDNEAKRIVRSLPKFIPGRQNGKAVNVWYTLPVTFRQYL